MVEHAIGQGTCTRNKEVRVKLGIFILSSIVCSEVLVDSESHMWIDGKD